MLTLEKLELKKDELLKADVILGVDKNNYENFSVFYGLDMLKKIAESNESCQTIVMHVPMDFSEESDDLEMLYAVVEVLRGHCDYQSAGE